VNGALHTTPNNLLDAHADLYPIELALLDACHRSLIRICTLPNPHPLHNIIDIYSTHHTCKHHTSLHKLLSFFSNICPQHVETVQPTSHYNNPPNTFSTLTTSGREELIKMEMNNDAEIKIFTDGSGIGGQVGAAAVLYRKGRPNPQKILQYHLGSLAMHTIYKGELVAAMLGAWLL
jgi:hypothetical protein